MEEWTDQGTELSSEFHALCQHRGMLPLVCDLPWQNAVMERRGGNV